MMYASSRQQREDKMIKTAQNIGYLIGVIALYFARAGFLMWGWNTIAPHLNAPTFSYWETFAIYMWLNALVGIFRKTRWLKKDN